VFKFAQSRIAASLQGVVSKRREESGLYAEVIQLLVLPMMGQLLEVGCGSGLQLKVAHESRPGLELFGLDISGAAIRHAMRNLEGIEVDLREGSIQSTSYEDGFFDVVTCLASMSYWDDLVTCYDEIFRILKPGGSAKLVEPQQDIDIDEVVETIKATLADKSRLRRFMAVNLNKYGLKYGRKIGLKLYSVDEIEQTAARSGFGGVDGIERVSLQNLPIFMLISMVKPGSDQIADE
jgi:ubiquinone/menaquinone biosynthesis C-methylase UbiE